MIFDAGAMIVGRGRIALGHRALGSAETFLDAVVIDPVTLDDILTALDEAFA